MKLQIIDIATKLFQTKGYSGVSLNEILKACDISKGALYHHFPNGKEELLVACLQNLGEIIIKDTEAIFESYPTTEKAAEAMISKIIVTFEEEGTVAGYTFSSIVSDMDSLGDSVRNTSRELYQQIQDIYSSKLMEDGFSEEAADSTALMLTASIEGGMMLCLVQESDEPLRIISQFLQKKAQK